MRDKIVALEYKTYGMVAVDVPVCGFVLLRGLPVDYKIAAGVLVKTAYDVQQRSLAAARLTQDTYQLALTERDGHSLEGVHRLAAGLVVLYDISDLKHYMLLSLCLFYLSPSCSAVAEANFE